MMDWNRFFSNLPCLAFSARCVSYTCKSIRGPQKGCLSYFRKWDDISFPQDRDEGLAQWFFRTSLVFHVQTKVFFPLESKCSSAQSKESVKGRKGEKPREGSEAGGEAQGIRFMSVRRKWYVQLWVRPRSCLLQDREREWVWKQALKLMKGSCIQGVLREIYLWRRNWFGAPVCSTVTAKYHERSQSCEWIWIQAIKGRNRARDRHQNIEGSWAGSLYQSSQSSVYHLCS